MIAKDRLKAVKKRLKTYDNRWAFTLAERLWPDVPYAYFRIYDVFNYKTHDPKRVVVVYKEAVKFIKEKELELKKIMEKY